MAHTEGYRLTCNDEDDRVAFRVSPKPYKKVKGHLRGRPEDLTLIKSALTEDEWSLGQVKLLYRDGVYYLHVTVKTEVEVPEPEDAGTLVGVDINERNIALTTLNPETVESPYNSKSCSCCGHCGYRQGRRLRSTNDSCEVQQGHADRNTSVNVAWRAWAKHAGVDVESVTYRTRKTQPFVRKVSLSGSGRSVNRPSSSRKIASRGVLTT